MRQLSREQPLSAIQPESDSQLGSPGIHAAHQMWRRQNAQDSTVRKRLYTMYANITLDA